MSIDNSLLSQLTSVVPMWICPVTKKQIPAANTEEINQHIKQVVEDQQEKERLALIRKNRKAYYSTHFKSAPHNFIYGIHSLAQLGDHIHEAFVAFDSKATFTITVPKIQTGSVGLAQAYFVIEMPNGSVELLSEIVRVMGITVLTKAAATRYGIAVKRGVVCELHAANAGSRQFTSYTELCKQVWSHNVPAKNVGAFKKLRESDKLLLTQSAEYRKLVAQRDTAIAELQKARDAVHAIDQQMTNLRDAYVKNITKRSQPVLTWES